MEGTIKAIKPLSNGMTLISYYDLDTTKGQSGSPVHLVRVKDGVKRYYTIGIHVGYDESLNENIATAITD